VDHPKSHQRIEADVLYAAPAFIIGMGCDGVHGAAAAGGGAGEPLARSAASSCSSLSCSGVFVSAGGGFALLNALQFFGERLDLLALQRLLPVELLPQLLQLLAQLLYFSICSPGPPTALCRRTARNTIQLNSKSSYLLQSTACQKATPNQTKLWGNETNRREGSGTRVDRVQAGAEDRWRNKLEESRKAAGKIRAWRRPSASARWRSCRPGSGRTGRWRRNRRPPRLPHERRDAMRSERRRPSARPSGSSTGRPCSLWRDCVSKT